MTTFYDSSRNPAVTRRDQRPEPRTSDSYRTQLRVPGGTGCRECGAIYDNGRWIWCATAQRTGQITCPACRRILEHAPAAQLHLQCGAYLSAHRAQLLALIEHQAQQEQRFQALERLMEIVEGPEEIVISTTGTHLLRRIGAAILRAHHGRLSIEYRDGEGLLRAHWSHPDAR